jgi:hypothetical protein
MVLAGLLLLGGAATSQAGVRIGVGIGLPFWGPPCYYRPYYYGPPVVYAPAPVYVAPAPAVVVQQPAPVVTRSPEQTAEPQPAPAPLPPPTAVRGARPEGGNLQSLNDPDPQVRADTIIALGRNRYRQAAGPIARALREDQSPVVREAAARALGLIALPTSLDALQRAAQADQDRDVRRSASFAAEVIRTNYRR